MMKFKINNMNNLILLVFIVSITLFSCRRSKESIGPDIAIASANFQVAGNSFKYNLATSKFANLGKNWFKASFNERVTWQIKIKGTKSKAYKILSGTSNVLDQSTSLWTGTQSGIYFFIAGEKAIAELSVYGSNQKWYDTTTISTVKGPLDYGSNALIWYDMDQIIVKTGAQGYTGYLDDAFYVTVPGVVNWGDLTTPFVDPVQGKYRSMMAKSSTPNTFWVGGFNMADLSPSATISTPGPKPKYYGFPGASLNEVYLNFYIRRKTPVTPSMGISVTSLSGKTFKSASKNPCGCKIDSIFNYIHTTLSYNVNFPIGSSAISNAGMPNDGYINAAGGGGNTTGGGEKWNSVPGTSVGPDSQLVVSLPPYPNLVTQGVPEGWSLVSVRLDQMSPESGKPPFDPSKIVSIGGSLATAELTGFDIDFIVFTRGVPFSTLMDQNP